MVRQEKQCRFPIFHCLSDPWGSPGGDILLPHFELFQNIGNIHRVFTTGPGNKCSRDFCCHNGGKTATLYHLFRKHHWIKSIKPDADNGTLYPNTPSVLRKGIISGRNGGSYFYDASYLVHFCGQKCIFEKMWSNVPRDILSCGIFSTQEHLGLGKVCGIRFIRLLFRETMET